MKKLGIMTVIVSVVFFLTGCGGGNKDPIKHILTTASGTIEMTDSEFEEYSKNMEIKRSKEAAEKREAEKLAAENSSNILTRKGFDGLDNREWYLTSKTERMNEMSLDDFRKLDLSEQDKLSSGIIADHYLRYKDETKSFYGKKYNLTFGLEYDSARGEVPQGSPDDSNEKIVAMYNTALVASSMKVLFQDDGQSYSYDKVGGGKALSYVFAYTKPDEKPLTAYTTFIDSEYKQTSPEIYIDQLIEIDDSVEAQDEQDEYYRNISVVLPENDIHKTYDYIFVGIETEDFKSDKVYTWKLSDVKIR